MTGTTDTVALAAEITAAYLTNAHSRLTVEDAPTFLASIHKVLVDLASESTSRIVDARKQAGDDQPEHARAVSVGKSLESGDHIISMIDGKPYRMLRKHLATHGLTPEQYRERYNLPASYPMVAPAYAERRREIAKSHSFGRKAGTKMPLEAAEAAPTVRTGKSGRKSVAEAKRAAVVHLAGK